MLIGYAAGGGADVVARYMSPKVAAALGQPIIVDNRAGANGNIATATLARAEPDGQTIMLGAIGQLALAPSLYKDLPFNVSRDIATVTKVSNATNILCLHPSVAASNVRDLVALAKAKSLNGGSAGVGNTGHLAIELLNLLTGTRIVHVPYKGGGPMIVGLLGGDVHLGFANPATAVAHIKEGKLKGLAVTTPQRSKLMPEFPTVAESGVPGFEANNWIGIVVPAKTPRSIINRYNKEFVAVLKSAEMAEFLSHLGIEADPGTPEEFARYIKSETEKWAKVVKQADIKAD